MTEDHETLRHAELTMLSESSRVAVELVTAIDDLIRAGQQLAQLAGVAWNDPAIDAWHDAVERGAEATEATEAYQAFAPNRWWP